MALHLNRVRCPLLQPYPLSVKAAGILLLEPKVSGLLIDWYVLVEQDSYIEFSQILLEREITINSYKDIKLLFSKGEQFAILYSCPSHLRHSLHKISWKLFGEPSVYAIRLEVSSRQAAILIICSLASSKKAITCSLDTVGKPSRKSSIDSPPLM